MFSNFRSAIGVTAVKLGGAAIGELCDGAVISKLNVGAPGLLMICSADRTKRALIRAYGGAGTREGLGAAEVVGKAALGHTSSRFTPLFSRPEEEPDDSISLTPGIGACVTEGGAGDSTPPGESLEIVG